MKPGYTHSPESKGPVKDPVGFLADFFHSSRFEVLSTLEQYDTGAETIISFINKYSQPGKDEENECEDWLHRKRRSHQPN